MKTLIVLLILTLSVYAFDFIQITDNHYDWDYKVSVETTKECRTTAPGDSGKYGYADRSSHCQTPIIILESAVQAAAEQYPSADAVLLTGDFSRSGNTKLNVTREEFLERMQEMTDVFANQWPDTIVLPTIGNHDWIPEGDLTPGPDELYNALADMWTQWLPGDAKKTFEQGGFYQVLPPNMPHLRFVVLNTCLYPTENSLTHNITDPAGQFAWVQQVFDEARTSGDVVWLLGHCNPGIEFQVPHNKRFVSILSQNADVIKGHVVGHIHHDLFGLVQDENGGGNDTVGVLFLCPSISPDNGKGGAHSPSFRVYHTNDSYDALDYTQITLNLTTANKELKANWEVEYSAADAYDLPDVSPASMRDLYERLDHNTTLFEVFWDRLWSGWQPASEHVGCNDTICSHLLLWDMRYLVPPIIDPE